MKRIITKNWLPLMATFLIAFSITLVGARVARTLLAKAKQDDNTQVVENPETGSEEPRPEVTPKTFIDLQPLVDDWVSETRGNTRNRQIGIMIYDLDNNKIAAEYNANAIFNSASIYKLFFAYDGYRQIDQGHQSDNELFVNTNDKGRLTYGECLDLMVRESYSPCADPMRNNNETYDRIEKFTQDLELKNTTDAGLSSTPADLIKLIQYIYQHQDLSEDSWQKLSDSMLNQPPTTNDWRQGLPSGFNRTRVYDKVGWLGSRTVWEIYNDAAILEFPDNNRHYAIVVMTENLPDTSALVKLGNLLETKILSEG